MTDLDKIISIAEDDRVTIGLESKDVLHKWLQLGMSRYVCRYGTLGEGHEKLTDAQRYAQCHREMWTRANEMLLQKSNALDAQADLLDAEAAVKRAKGEAASLRAQAQVLKAKQKLTNATVSMEDTMRQLDEFNRVRLELKEAVEAQYPKGIEQAEEDNWKTVATYRARMEIATGQPQNLKHVPLPTGEKAKLGLHTKNAEMLIAQSIENPEKLARLLQQPVSKETN